MVDKLANLARLRYSDAEKPSIRADLQRMIQFVEKLNELEEGCRKLLLQNWRGLKLDEVAAMLKISYAYARKRKSECMAKLVMLMKKSPQYEQLKW